MTEDPGKRPRFQFRLSAIFAFTAVIGAVFASANVDPTFLPLLAMYVAIPFVVGLGVGLFSGARAQLLVAPAVAAAIAPLPWAIMAAIFGTTLTGNPLLDFLRWWVMLFPVFLVLGAIPAFAGSALGYWFKGRIIFR